MAGPYVGEWWYANLKISTEDKTVITITKRVKILAYAGMGACVVRVPWMGLRTLDSERFMAKAPRPLSACFWPVAAVLAFGLLVAAIAM